MDNTKENLPFRSQEILNWLVLDYIQTAEPIGSRTIARKYFKRLSSATIRNVMSDLEESGYLASPHTSAGRIPTDKGLRFYVDTLVKQRELSDIEKEEIRQRYPLPEEGLRSLVKKTSHVLATFSQYVGLVVTPKWKQTIFKHMEFLPLSQKRLLGIFVTQSGWVRNRILEVEQDFTHADLEKMNNYCNKVFYGLSLEEAKTKIKKELEEDQNHYDRLLSKALVFAATVLKPAEEAELFLEGESQLFNHPEFAEIEKVQKLVNVLEEKQKILTLLECADKSPDVQIFIGSENSNLSLENVSMVTAQYKKADEIFGTLGVIGPKSMDYARVIPIVDFTAKLLGDFLTMTA